VATECPFLKPVTPGKSLSVLSIHYQLLVWDLLNNTDLQSKTSIDEIRVSFNGYFVGAEHEYDIKNCCLALVSKIQEAAFMYSAF
jgi:hypothetical protein